MLKAGDRVKVYKNTKQDGWYVEDYTGMFISFGVDSIEGYSSFSSAIIEKDDGFLTNVDVNLVKVI
jgi:hypothetical protein